MCFFPSFHLFFSIDVTNATGQARMVNDAVGKAVNCKMDLFHGSICLFAVKDIQPGKELRYDYGVVDLPWRKVCNSLF